MSGGIVKTFEKLKQEGLEAKNPDQSAAMFNTFREQIGVCRWKGFSEADIDTLFKAAKEAPKKG